jgi:hypothetical protein
LETAEDRKEPKESERIIEGWHAKKEEFTHRIFRGFGALNGYHSKQDDPYTLRR